MNEFDLRLIPKIEKKGKNYLCIFIKGFFYMNNKRFFWLFIVFMVVIGGVFVTLALTDCGDGGGGGGGGGGGSGGRGDTSTTDPAGTYIITGSGASFTAKKDGVTIGTANRPIQDIIDAVQGHAPASYAIKFGSGSAELDIGEDGFTLTGGTITLSGKITASGSLYVVSLQSGASIISTADIKHTGYQGGIWNWSTGTITISGGTVSATNGTAIRNNSTGAVNITGGTVSTTGPDTIAIAVWNQSTGKITVSGTALVTSENTDASYGTIYLREGSAAVLEITGGTVSNTSADAGIRNAIYNNSNGNINISGGRVETASTKTPKEFAVNNAGGGVVTIGGGATIVGVNYGVSP